MTKCLKKYLDYPIEKLMNVNTLNEIYLNEEIYDDPETFYEIIEKLSNISITKKNFFQIMLIALKYNHKHVIDNCLKYLFHQYDIRIETDEFRVLSVEIYQPEPNLKVIGNLIEHLFSFYKKILNISFLTHKIKLIIDWEENRIFYHDFIIKFCHNIQSITYLSSIDIPSYTKELVYDSCINLEELKFLMDLSTYDNFEFHKYSLNKLKSIELRWVNKKNTLNLSNLSIESLVLMISEDVRKIEINNLFQLKFLKIFSFFELELVRFDNVPNVEYLEVSNCPKLTNIYGVENDVIRTINCPIFKFL